MNKRVESRPFLSIIIPAYNEERRLPGTLTQIMEYLSHQDYQAEVLVVENASTDGTCGVVQQFMAEHPSIQLIQSPVRGKGSAVRLGMLSARGQYCFLCDADLSMPIDQLDKFLPPWNESVDIVIGSREAEGAHRYGEPPHRHTMGRVFARLVQFLAVRGYEDTQCGFKLFRREAVPSIFRYQTLNGWGFDAEVLYIAEKRGYRVAEVGIDWYYNTDSRVRPVHDSLQMMRDLLRIRLNDLRGRYDIYYHANSLPGSIYTYSDPNAALQPAAVTFSTGKPDHAGDVVE